MTDDSDLRKLLDPGGAPPQRMGVPPGLAPLVDNPGTLSYEQIGKLNQAAKVADSLAGEFRGLLRSVGAPTDAATDALRDGFTSAGALAKLMDSWSRSMRSMADQTDGLGPRLSRTAAAYRGAESNIRSRINEIWKILD
ncbi:WXG100 family type VII secretion target [Thermomonospora amylolytica]|uniref:WXG100 family type VII secretion target n=1 Tax=Thermomonospora amylolytica TaxID=1411117 RepID=UPI000E6B64E7|nr:type VII secretion target [Thermomonospora amylolytica]